MFKTSFIFP